MEIRKLRLMIILFLFLIFGFIQAQDKMNMAILDFASEGGLTKSEATTLTNRLRSMLVKTDAYNVLERGRMEEVLGEIGFQMSGCTSTECAVEVGKILNVQQMISGTIGKLGKTYTIDIAIIDVGTAKIIRTLYRDYKGEIDGIVVYDDYAHHPTEIEATLKGVKDSTENRIVAVFQPHLFSRTQDFYEDFGRSFFHSDVLIVTPIYPAREKPIPGVTGKLISDIAIQSGHKNVHYVDSNEKIIEKIKELSRSGDIVITMGAGSIYKFGESFLKEN